MRTAADGQPIADSPRVVYARMRIGSRSCRGRPHGEIFRLPRFLPDAPAFPHSFTARYADLSAGTIGPVSINFRR